jgi:hypothetical protein
MRYYGSILIIALISIGAYYMLFNYRWENSWLNSTFGSIVAFLLYLIVVAAFAVVIVVIYSRQ